MKLSAVPWLVALLAPAQAAITISFNAPFIGGLSSNLADSSGTVQNGLAYGILVDNNGDGVLTQYDPGFNLQQGSLINLTSNDGNSTDDQLFVSLGVNAGDHLTNNSTAAFLEGNGVTPGGNGAVSGLTDVPNSVAGKRFALIWFDLGQAVNTTVGDGETFGLLTDASFVLPAAGFTSTFDGPFVGTDPVRPANTGIFTIPEPFTPLLIALGVCGFLRRRV